MVAESLMDLSADYHLDLLATGVILLDANLHIRELNLSAENLLEVSASRALGSPLEDSLFEQQDSDTAAVLDDDILLLLENYEPRIKNVDVVCSYDLDSTDMNVRISYIIAGLQFPQQNIEFILQSTRV